MLFDPGFVIELFFETLKGTVRLVRILDNKRSLKFILELSDEFCEEIE